MFPLLLSTRLAYCIYPPSNQVLRHVSHFNFPEYDITTIGIKSVMFGQYVIIVSFALIAASVAFAPIPSQTKVTKFRGQPTESNMKLKVLLAPQIIFIASCAGAVFAYVYTNLDSIMEVKSIDGYQVTVCQQSLILFTISLQSAVHDGIFWKSHKCRYI